MSHKNAIKTAEIIRDAGGRVIGRTRLQKIAYLLSITGLEEGLSFCYKHYGPYSEDLATAARDASLLGLLNETEYQASWGGTYSIYTTHVRDNVSNFSARYRLAAEAAAADAIDLELAATAAYLAIEGFSDPWLETARRKPEKAASDRIDRAKALYTKISEINTPTPLPAITSCNLPGTR